MATASTDELLAVHEEFLTLIRAGMPLERGLAEFARDVPGRMRPLVHELTNLLAQGHDPAAALERISSPEARAYAAVLAVGIRSGRPAEALQGIVGTVRRTQGFRSGLSVELIYPMLVLLVGTALIVFSLLNIAPVNALFSERFNVDGPIVRVVEGLATQSTLTLILLASAIVLLSLWLVPGLVGATALHRGGQWRPWQQIRAWQSLAIFLDQLALLVEHQTPLAQAIALAGKAVAWPPLARAVDDLAQRISRGENRPTVQPPLPPVVGWLLQSPVADQLPKALRREAEHYRRRSDRRQRWFTFYFPLLATLAIGVTCLAVLVFSNVAPLVNLYYQLSTQQP
jgi:type II secretory pathway component PulF